MSSRECLEKLKGEPGNGLSIFRSKEGALKIVSLLPARLQKLVGEFIFLDCFCLCSEILRKIGRDLGWFCRPTNFNMKAKESSGKFWSIFHRENEYLKKIACVNFVLQPGHPNSISSLAGVILHNDPMALSLHMGKRASRKASSSASHAAMLSISYRRKTLWSFSSGWRKRGVGFKGG